MSKTEKGPADIVGTLDVLVSLMRCIESAGGHVPLEKLLKMSVSDFIVDIAVPVGLRFTVLGMKISSEEAR